jgi:hypothetical protein
VRSNIAAPPERLYTPAMDPFKWFLGLGYNVDAGELTSGADSASPATVRDGAGELPSWEERS